VVVVKGRGEGGEGGEERGCCYTNLQLYAHRQKSYTICMCLQDGLVIYVPNHGPRTINNSQIWLRVIIIVVKLYAIKQYLTLPPALVHLILL